MTEPMRLVSPDRDDCRRAAALLSHYAQRDGQGVLAVLTEAAEAGRGAEMILQMAHLVVLLIPSMREEPALSMLHDIALMMSGDEDTGDTSMTVREW